MKALAKTTVTLTVYTNGFDYDVEAVVSTHPSLNEPEVTLTSAKVDGRELLGKLFRCEEEALEEAAYDKFVADGRSVRREVRDNNDTLHWMERRFS